MSARQSLLKAPVETPSTGTYECRRRFRLPLGLTMLMLIGTGALAALALLVEGHPSLAGAVAVLCAIAVGGAVATRTGQAGPESAVLVGGGWLATVIASTWSERAAARGHAAPRLLRATSLADATNLIRSTTCDEVIVVEPLRPILPDVTDRRGKRPTVRSGGEKIEDLLGRIPLELAQQDPFLARVEQQPVIQGGYAIAKRALDILVSFVLGLIVLPTLPLIALAIKLDSPGPIFYSQDRVGLGGRIFRIYKFRTMRQDAERDGAVWASEHDPRVTRVGRFMRLTRIDELPQLWNVFRGDMTLVGPRPERPEFTTELAAALPGYNLRHVVKPGLTGWAQVSYRYTSSIRDTRTKLEYDLYYIKHASLGLDLTILWRTVGVVLGMRGR
ncbi:MAG TPA: sugar transferase [Thermomicrobiales bacterium]